MPKYHEYLSTLPFDLFDLTLFGLVAETGSFTAAGARAGLTQSAITRRIATMENKLGVRLFERTTRNLRLTPAGLDFRERTIPLLDQTFEIAGAFATGQGLRPPELSIGVARSIGLAYLPGFFFAFQKDFPKVLLNVTQEDSRDILNAVEDGELDAGLLCPPKTLPRGLLATHRFSDDFILIAPPDMILPKEMPLLKKRLAGERWLTIKQTGNTGKALLRWQERHAWKSPPAMELDSFDMIANLVSLGLGVAMVPHRVLPIYERRRAVQRIPLRQRFRRELAVVIRKERRHSVPVRDFIDRILF